MVIWEQQELKNSPITMIKLLLVKSNDMFLNVFARSGFTLSIVGIKANQSS